MIPNQHPNIQLIHSFFEAYAANDLTSIKNILSDDIEWIIPGRHPLSGVKTGAEEVLNYFKQLNASDFKASPIVMGFNDEFIIDCHLNWSNRTDGENVRGMSCLLWKFKDGKISKVYNFPEDQHMIDAFFNKTYPIIEG
ncbi:nuclear transport factor 2 family protein [Mucilaginibacter rigui]|uniref:Nuclear transport factor 2 family protein n=1 Tax=Mucilaginibacter rigui TaxID=534635 RepID=A0ABR7X9R8_9SPHI|nr:nuclear transport factor 2 family protein [Mucilaginibacter rigui]MBD1387328.1 nuclear transport factor 2 family protein [Mucilaginibacter rigui]